MYMNLLANNINESHYPKCKYKKKLLFTFINKYTYQ